MQDGQVTTLTGGDHNHEPHTDKIEKFLKKQKERKSKCVYIDKMDLN